MTWISPIWCNTMNENLSTTYQFPFALRIAVNSCSTSHLTHGKSGLV